MTWPAPDFEHLLISSRAMQQLEEALFAKGLPVAALMEQAGLGLAQAVLQNTDLKRHGLLVLVGPGQRGHRATGLDRWDPAPFPIEECPAIGRSAGARL